MNGMVPSNLVVCDSFVFTLITISEELTLRQFIFQGSHFFLLMAIISRHLASGCLSIFFSCCGSILLLVFVFLVSLLALFLLLVLSKLALLVVWAHFFDLIVLHSLNFVLVVSLTSSVKACGSRLVGSRLFLRKIGRVLIILLLHLVVLEWLGRLAHCCSWGHC